MQALLDAIARIEPGTDARRVFHGRGGLYPGCEQWTLDAFPPVWLLTSFQPVTDDTLAVSVVMLQALHRLGAHGRGGRQGGAGRCARVCLRWPWSVLHPWAS